MLLIPPRRHHRLRVKRQVRQEHRNQTPLKRHRLALFQAMPVIRPRIALDEACALGAVRFHHPVALDQRPSQPADKIVLASAYGR